MNLEAKKVFSKVGLATVITIIVVNLIQLLMMKLGTIINPEIVKKGWYTYILLGVSFYLIGFPLFCAIVNNLPDGEKKEYKKYSIGKVIILLIIAYALMYFANIFTNVFILIVQAIKGKVVTNPLVNIVGNNNWMWTLIFVGILSPIVEEMMFRGVMLNKLRPYGDKVAIITTAILFGLFHGNFSQFFYATVLGIVFAYVTLKSGTIKYSIILHIGINIIGSVITPLIIGDGTNVIKVGIVGIITLAIVIPGVVLLIINKKKINLLEGDVVLEKGKIFNTVWVNSGMVINLCVSVVLMISILLM